MYDYVRNIIKNLDLDIHYVHTMILRLTSDPASEFFG